jgi:hypothetical protein
MKKTYNYKNGTIYVSGLDTYDRESFKKATEKFLKKVISGGNKIGNSNSSRDFW